MICEISTILLLTTSTTATYRLINPLLLRYRIVVLSGVYILLINSSLEKLSSFLLWFLIVCMWFGISLVALWVPKCYTENKASKSNVFSFVFLNKPFLSAPGPKMLIFGGAEPWCSVETMVFIVFRAYYLNFVPISTGNSSNCFSGGSLLNLANFRE